MLFVARLSWEFAQQAEAHEAYLITELGNLFPVDDAADRIGNVDQTGLGVLASGVTQALLGFMAGITEKDTDFQFLTGTDSIGTLHDYTSFFTVPSNVVNSTSGHVGIYREGDAYTSYDIPAFFSTYVYQDGSDTLRESTYGDAMPAFDTIATTAYGSSKKTSDAGVVSNGYGFYAYSGSYIVKLHPDKIYTIPYDLTCYNDVCDRISIISSDSNLLGTTNNGLFLRRAAGVSEDGAIVTSGSLYTHQYGTNIFDSTQRVVAYVPLGNVRVSSAGNVYGDQSSLVLDYTINQRCYSRGTHGLIPTSTPTPIFTPNQVFYRSGATTNVNDGLHFAEKLRFSTTFSYHEEWERHGHNTDPRCGLLLDVDWDCRSHSWGHSCDLASSTLDTRTVDLGSLHTTPIQVFDAGVPINDHLAYWSQNSSRVYANTTNTAANPPYVSATGNNVYMLVENNLGGSIAVDGYDLSAASLSITNLPRNTIYSITGTGLANSVFGVTDGAGNINIVDSNRFNGVYDLKLNVFRDALVFTNLSGMTVIDHFNNAYFNVPSAVRDSVVYTTTKYVDMPIPLDDTEITSVGVGLLNCEDGRLDLPYLAGTYNGGDNLLVPVIPGFDRVCYVINGDTFTLKYADIRQNADVGFGESKGNSNDVDTPISGSVGTTANVALPITALESGRLEVVVEGIVRSESDMSYIRTYKGEANMPGDTAFDPDPIDRRYGRHCDDTMGIPGWQYDSISAVPGWEYGGIANMEPLSDIPDPSSRVSATISVSKNGDVVLTKTVLTDVLTDLNTREINTSVPEVRKSYPSYFSLGLYSQNSIGYWCLPDRDDDNHVELAEGIDDGQYMLCSSGVYSYFGAFERWIRVPVCVTPERAAECGYEITQRQQRSVFGDTITLDNVEIGDVIEVDITATYRVSLEEFTCNGQTTGNNFKRGTVTVDILNPSVQVQ